MKYNLVVDVVMFCVVFMTFIDYDHFIDQLLNVETFRYSFYAFIWCQVDVTNLLCLMYCGRIPDGALQLVRQFNMSMSKSWLQTPCGRSNYSIHDNYSTSDCQTAALVLQNKVLLLHDKYNLTPVQYYEIIFDYLIAATGVR